MKLVGTSKTATPFSISQKFRGAIHVLKLFAPTVCLIGSLISPQISCAMCRPFLYFLCPSTHYAKRPLAPDMAHTRRSNSQFHEWAVVIFVVKLRVSAHVRFIKPAAPPGDASRKPKVTISN